MTKKITNTAQEKQAQTRKASKHQTRKTRKHKHKKNKQAHASDYQASTCIRLPSKHQNKNYKQESAAERAEKKENQHKKIRQELAQENKRVSPQE